MIQITQLGTKPYNDVWQTMKYFTEQRHSNTEDELWLLEHLPVYTQGQAGKAEHILNPTSIPVIHSDRGGQATYHGPGQLVAYVLMDLRRKKLGVRTLVTQLEQILISLLAKYDIAGKTKCHAPGVYVSGKKIASIGLRVKNGCTYHGLALNVAMDLKPFLGINPCGYSSLKMTQIKEFVPNITMAETRKHLVHEFLTTLP